MHPIWNKLVLIDCLFAQYQCFNYTTGMVYQTTILSPNEAGFEEAVGAKEGSEWYMCPNGHIRR